MNNKKTENFFCILTKQFIGLMTVAALFSQGVLASDASQGAMQVAQTGSDAFEKNLEQNRDTNLEQNSKQSDVQNNADEIIVPALQGVVFWPAMADLRTYGVAITDIDSASVPILNNPAFRQRMQGYIGQPLSFGSLQTLIDAVVVFAREQGHPVVDVFVPEQEITHNSIQIIVMEGLLGEVNVKGNRWFREAIFRKNMRLKPGESVNAEILEEDIAWLNRNPFRQVDAVFVQGRQPGTTDMTVQVQERYPVRVYATYENSGNKILGRDLYGVGVNWGNVFDTDHQAGYQYNRTGKEGALNAHSVDYSIPLDWRHILSFSGSYATVDSELFDIFGMEGRSSRVSGRYWLPLSTAHEGLNQNLQLGADYKRSNNNLEYFGTQIFDDTADIVQFALEYSASLPDSGGLNSWHGNIFYSPGGLTSDNETENFEAARSGAEAQYAYLKIGYERLQRLPANYTLAFSSRYQHADGRLLPSEQFGLGGRTSVRGFEERETSGDHGILLTTELRSPGFNLPGHTATSAHQLQLLAFVDWGKAEIADPLMGENQDEELASVGVGFRHQWSHYLSVRADFGWQTAGKNIEPEDDHRAQVSIMLSY